MIGESAIGKSSLLQAIYQQAETELKPPRKPIYLNLEVEIIRESQGHPQQLMNLCHKNYANKNPTINNY